uniref:Uncharacterized protein n=1 Tax=Anopheles atroparvus TaxID=41427 RepID=A0AAG5CUZ6_ANOAO
MSSGERFSPRSTDIRRRRSYMTVAISGRGEARPRVCSGSSSAHGIMALPVTCPETDIQFVLSSLGNSRWRNFIPSRVTGTVDLSQRSRKGTADRTERSTKF